MPTYQIPAQTINVYATANASQTLFTLNTAAETINIQSVGNNTTFNITSNVGNTIITIPLMNVNFTLNANVYNYIVLFPNGGFPNSNLNLASASVRANALPVGIPGPVSNVVAVAGNTTATISFTPSSSNGASPIINYTITSTAFATDGHTFTTNNNPATMTSLTNDVPFQVYVIANNAEGNSIPVFSNIVTPEGNVVATALTQLATTWGFFTGTGNNATVATQLITSPGTYKPFFNQPSTQNEYMQTMVIIVNGSNPRIVQQINNEGPNPGTTQDLNGITTSSAKKLTANNFLLAFTTCATYGGAHTSWTLTDTEGNIYSNPQTLTGGQGNLNSDQQLVMWTCNGVKGDTSANNIWTQKFNSGDNDYQAFYGLELSGVSSIVGSNSAIQNNVAPGPNTVSPGLVTVLANQVPCMLISFCTNISELGTGYTPTVGGSQSLTVPSAVRNVVATAGDTTTSVVYVAPSSNGGSPILSYTIYSTDGLHTFTTNNNPALMTALTDNQAYQFNVIATNAQGNSAPTISNSVTPVASASGFTGNVSVSGSSLINSVIGGGGAVVQLRGGNMGDMQYTYVQNNSPPWSGHVPNGARSAQWKLNSWRIAVNAGSLLKLTSFDGSGRNGGFGSGTFSSWGSSRACDPLASNPTTNAFAELITTVKAAQAAGAYAIIDMHWSAPKFTFGGVTNYLSPLSQPAFLDMDMAWDAWRLIIDTFGTNAPAIAGINPNGVLFELFNEPAVNDCINIHGAVCSVTGGGSDPDVLKRLGGTLSHWSDNQGYVVNMAWNVLGYQTILNYARTNGHKNVCIVNGDQYSGTLGQYTKYMPVDTLSPPQVAFGWHTYGSGSYPYSNGNVYPGCGNDAGNGTLNAWNAAQAILNAGHPVIITEDGGSGAPSNSSQSNLEPHITHMQQQCDTRGISYIPWQWTYVQNYNAFNGSSYQWMCLAFASDGTTVVPAPGQGNVNFAWTSNHAA